MKALTILFFAALTLESAEATSTLPFYEAFPVSYGDGTLIGAGATATKWDIGNTGTSAGALVTNSAALAYTGLRGSNSFGLLINGTPSSTRNRGATFTPQVLTNSNPTVYASLLLNVGQLPTNARLFAGLSTSGSGTSASGVIGLWLDPVGRLLLSKNSSSAPTATNAAALTPGTHLVVLRYKWNPSAGDDEVGLWLDPSPLGAAEGSVPSANVTTTNGADVSPLQSFWIFHPSTASVSATLSVDEVRVGNTWADVTPSDGPPAPAPTPVITQALLLAQGMVLRGTNGLPSGSYQVITSPNVALALSNWPSIATRSFDVKGNFDSTNPVAPGLGRQFFRLLVGRSNPPASTPPTITNQPQSLAVAVGATANFLVSATGTAPLDYFWSFNTNTFVGGNSNALTLLNVQTNNAGNYRVIVSNSIGTVTSSVATLTVLVPPAITASPTNLIVLSGGSGTFNVIAAGSAPLCYQWYFNTNTPIVNATNAAMLLTPVALSNAGAYSVVVTNPVGTATSSAALLTVLSAPVITAPPQSQSVIVSNNATFYVTATGTAPLAYQWFFNTNTPLPNATNASVTILSVKTNNAGTYSVRVTNTCGAVNSAPATLTITGPITNSTRFNLMGFGQGTTGGGVIPETNPAYVKVTNAFDLAVAIRASYKTAGSVKVIEIMNDLDLGWNEIGTNVQALDSNPFREHNPPKLHPRLLTTGVSLIDIKSKSGLTIFSANGATIRHACFNVKDTANIIIRNLKFDEMWEWDESSKGKYDGNDWDFIDLGNGGTVNNIWIDHCTFTKAYDGICDIKGGSYNITFSWNKYVGDDGTTNPNSFVRQQIRALEANAAAYPMYNFLRTHGFSVEDIVTIIQGHDKTHLIGANSLSSENGQHTVTFHHQWHMNPWDRLPRLRAGNVHNFNLYVDDTVALAARRLRDARAAALSPSDQNTLDNTYSFQPFLNGSISTENGAVLVEKSVYIDCLWPLRNNQTDPSDPTYTGKILALDSIYHFDNADSTTVDYRGDSTNAPGDTYFGPAQAAVIPFSWNTNAATPNGRLPYSYTMDDPSQLQAIVSSPTAGAGAGVLLWNKTNWLNTSY